MNGLKRAVGEVHRRSLWQVLGIYVAGSWIALQAVDVLAKSAGLPDWFPSFALALLIIGLPIVLATAFVQEGLPGDDGSGHAATSNPASSPAEEALHGGGQRPEAGRRLLTWRNALLGGVGAFALWGVVATGWMFLGGPAGADPARASEGAAGGSGVDRQSVAVLPFAIRSAVAEDSFFVQGVHDDILTQLARIGDLKVISRTSVMQYAGTEKPIRQIAQELGVGTVLEGGVQRAGDRIRVTAQLIDAGTDGHLWAANYDEALTTENVFAIQTQIAQAIAEALEAHLTRAEQARIATRPTENLEAYDLYNRGRYLWREGTTTSRLAATDLFRRATEIDPGFATAFAEFGRASVLLIGNGEAPATDEARATARAAVERAIRLDPELGEAHLARGHMLEVFDVDLVGAEQEYRRALELSPGSSSALNALAGLHLTEGRLDESREEFQRAVDIDPLATAPRANLSFVDFVSRDYAAAETQAARFVELDPRDPNGYYYLAAALSFQDRHAEAIAAARNAVQRDSVSPANLIMLGFIHARAGDRDSAIAIANRVEKKGGSLKEIALVYGTLGDIDLAFAYLERSLESNPGEIAGLDIDPSADPLRKDPRYRDLLRRAGLAGG